MVTVLRRYLFATPFFAERSDPERPNTFEVRANDALSNMRIERYRDQRTLPQLMEVEIEISARDYDAMFSMHRDAELFMQMAREKYLGVDFVACARWDLTFITPGMRIISR